MEQFDYTEKSPKIKRSRQIIEFNQSKSFLSFASSTSLLKSALKEQ